MSVEYASFQIGDRVQLNHEKTLDVRDLRGGEDIPVTGNVVEVIKDRYYIRTRVPYRIRFDDGIDMVFREEDLERIGE